MPFCKGSIHVGRATLAAWLIAACALLTVGLIGAAEKSSAAAPPCPLGVSYGPVAKMCAGTTENMYGYFFTYVESPVAFAAGSVPDAVAYNNVRFYTGTNRSNSVETGLRVRNNDNKGSLYQPYWATDGTSFVFHAIGSEHSTADGKNHTFVVKPNCANCKRYNISYDFNPVAAGTPDLADASSHYLDTGWELYSEYRRITYAAVENRVQFLTGNSVWNRFLASDTSMYTDKGVCDGSGGIDACWAFITQKATQTVGTQSFATLWKVTKSLTPYNGTARVPDETPAASARAEYMSQGEALAAAAKLRGAGLGDAGQDSGQERKVFTRSLKFQQYASLMDLDSSAAPPTTGDVWVVSSAGSMRTPTGNHRLVKGYTLAFDRTTGGLVDACLGKSCRLIAALPKMEEGR